MMTSQVWLWLAASLAISFAAESDAKHGKASTVSNEIIKTNEIGAPESAAILLEEFKPSSSLSSSHPLRTPNVVSKRASGGPGRDYNFGLGKRGEETGQPQASPMEPNTGWDYEPIGIPVMDESDVYTSPLLMAQLNELLAEERKRTNQMDRFGFGLGKSNQGLNLIKLIKSLPDL